MVKLISRQKGTILTRKQFHHGLLYGPILCREVRPAFVAEWTFAGTKSLNLHLAAILSSAFPPRFRSANLETRMSVRFLALPIALLPFLFGSGADPRSDLDQARAHYESKEYEPAAELLMELIASDGSNAEAHELLASALSRLSRNDEAAHHFENAYEFFTEAGEEKIAREAKARLYRADPHASARHKLFARIASRVVDSAEKLAEQGSVERALTLVQGVLPIARGKDLAEAEKLQSKLAAAYEKVDLTAAGSNQEEGGGFPLFESESLRYDLECNLEPEVVKLIGETMDSIYDYYVSLYFDGDASATEDQRATIRIFGTKPEMDDYWTGTDPPYGWWSPGNREVVCFDTRTQGGSLDPLLNTLFHEASHQFMTLMTKGGGAPSWLNEGTSCFFEGAVAMADNRVLWPDAAIGRLRNLKFMLENKQGPTPRAVIEYMNPGSYDGSYYAFGWGYVYFLQQYEDPDTLEYVYRPLYAEYRDEVTTKPRDSMELFEEIFLGRKSPRGHKTFEEFEADWIDWIINQVAPLHLANPADRRSLRLAKIERYLGAADEAQGKTRADVSEDELLRRALGHLEYIRTKIDDEENPDPELVLRQATILERLSFRDTAAPLLELWLNLADGDSFEPEEELYKEVEKRLKAIDSKNYKLRRVRNKVKELINNSRKLLAKYERNKEPMPLRSYTFAAALADIFVDDTSLAEDAERLKRAARDAGVLRGLVKTLLGSDLAWGKIYSRNAKKFECGDNELTIRSLAAMARTNTDLELSGEYELRANLKRVGKLHRGSGHGLVVGGTPKGDWFIVGLTGKNKLGVWQILFEGGGTTTPKAEIHELSEAPPETGEIPILVHVYDETRMTVKIGSAKAIELIHETRIPPKRHAGVFVKDGELSVTEFVVETYP